MTKQTPKTRDGHKARSAARLASIQALYQLEHGGAGIDDVIKEFLDHYMGAEIDGEAYIEGDAKMFSAIVRGVVERQIAIDGALDRCLPEEWPLHRLDSILRAVMRAGAFELMAHPHVPARVVINEYLDVVHAFIEGSEAAMANGVLDRLARFLRPDEFKSAANLRDA